VAEPFARRALIEDDRHQGAYLRATWHPERRIVVVSHWNDDVCVAATRVPLEGVSELVGVLVSGLQEAATRQVGSSADGFVGSAASSGRQPALLTRLSRVIWTAIRRLRVRSS
jgi:hypothetical protein